MKRQTIPALNAVVLKAVLLSVVLVVAMRSPSSLAAPAATVRYVQAGGASAGTCDSWAAACELQHALSVAVDGDQIWVAAGIHTPTPTTDRTLSFHLKPGVAIYGGFSGTETSLAARNPNPATNATVLSGEIDEGSDSAGNSYHVVVASGVTETAVLDGFTITGGNADGAAYLDGRGGGMLNDAGSPTVRNCTFLRNSARYGGGMFNGADSSPTLSACTFAGNSARGGGGMFSLESTLTLTNCTFTGNSAIWGGGMANEYGSAALSHCTFTGNSAQVGGGMINDDSALTLTHCTFTGNSAGEVGGGMVHEAGSLLLDACTFAGNSAVIFGGALFHAAGSSTLTNCTFTGNSAYYGGGMTNASSAPTLTHCTFSGNSAGSGGALYNMMDSSPTLTNCILWGDGAEEISSDDTSFPVVTYSDVQGGYPGTGNIDADPLFVDPDSGDFHLQRASPCVDAGTNAAPNMPEFDFEGDPRVIDGNWDGTAVADMGVDEVSHYTVYLPQILSGQ